MKSAADVLAQERNLLALFDEVGRDQQGLKVKGLGHRSQTTGKNPQTARFVFFEPLRQPPVHNRDAHGAAVLPLPRIFDLRSPP